MRIKISRTITLTGLIGALVLVPISAFAGSDQNTAAPSVNAESGNQAMVSMLHDMSKVMQHWMTTMSDPRGLSPAESKRLAGEMQTMSGMMRDMSSMMQTAPKTGSGSSHMMKSGEGMMNGNGDSMMMNSRMMQRMHEQMQKLLANEES